EVGAADGHHPLAVAGGVGVAHGAGVEAAVERFDLGDGRVRAVGGVAADGGGGVQCAGQQVRGGARVAQFTGDAGGQVPHGGGGDRCGLTGHVEAAAVGAQRLGDGLHDHGVFGAFLGGGEQGGGVFPVPGRVGVAGGGAGQRVGHHRAAVFGDEQFGAG